MTTLHAAFGWMTGRCFLSVGALCFGSRYIQVTLDKVDEGQSFVLVSRHWYMELIQNILLIKFKSTVNKLQQTLLNLQYLSLCAFPDCIRPLQYIELFFFYTFSCQHGWLCITFSTCSNIDRFACFMDFTIYTRLSYNHASSQWGFTYTQKCFEPNVSMLAWNKTGEKNVY